jgi:heme-degrading monooxygenase HmoA
MLEPGFAERTSLNVKPDKVEDFLSEVRNSLNPKMKEQAGIRRLYLLRSPEKENEFVSLSLWDNKDAAEQYERSDAYKETMSSLSGFLESEPSLTHYNVELRDVNAEELPPPEAAVEKAEKENTTRSTRRKRTSTKKPRTKKGKGRRSR